MQLISTINQFWQEFLAVALLAFIAGALAGWYIKSLCCLDEPKGRYVLYAVFQRLIGMSNLLLIKTVIGLARNHGDQGHPTCRVL